MHDDEGGQHASAGLPPARTPARAACLRTRQHQHGPGYRRRHALTGELAVLRSVSATFIVASAHSVVEAAIAGSWSRAPDIPWKLGMSGALAQVGIARQGTHHRGIDDARNIARLLPFAVGARSRSSQFGR